MRLVFSGFEGSIELSTSYVRTLEIENKTLFCRVCQSLASGEGEEALEPYSVWGGEGEELTPRDSLLVVADPLALPWDSKPLGGGLFERIERLTLEDEEARREIEETSAQLSNMLLRLTHQVNADYDFGVEWEIKRYLKSFSFEVDHLKESSYLDSLIAFFDFASDMALKQALVFMNLKSFLSEKDTTIVFEQAIFHDLSLLLLESHLDAAHYEYERKTLIDQHFLEW